MILSTDFINLDSDQIDGGIQRALEAIGSFLIADRSYVFLFSTDGKLMSNTHEWCAEKIEPQRENLQDLPIDIYPWWIEKLKGWETILVPDVDNMPEEAHTEKEILQSQKIKSLVVIPIMYAEDLLGFIGFDSVKEHQIWEEKRVRLLRTVGEMIAVLLRRKAYESQIKEAQKEAERANLAKSAFLANISHEIRTPMNAVIGISKLLSKKKNDNLTQKQQEGLSLIYSSGIRLLNIIDDLLDLSKIEAGKLEVTISEFSPRHLLDEISSMTKSLLEEKPIELTVTSNLPETIKTDYDKLRQILINLAGNAAKYTEKGTVSIHLELEGETIIGRVTDSGIGIKPEYLPHIFEAFTQGDLSTEKKFQGTGLGLALCKRFVDLLSGTIEIRNNQSSGITTSFSIPAAQVYRQNSGDDTLAETSSVLISENGIETKKRILIIDDDDSIIKTYQMMLEEDYELICALSPEKGIELYKMKRPDLVIMEIMMPGKSGYETLLDIRSLKKTANPSVIAVTARAEG